MAKLPSLRGVNAALKDAGKKDGNLLVRKRARDGNYRDLSHRSLALPWKDLLPTEPASLEYACSILLRPLSVEKLRFT